VSFQTTGSQLWRSRWIWQLINIFEKVELGLHIFQIWQKTAQIDFGKCYGRLLKTAWIQCEQRPWKGRTSIQREGHTNSPELCILRCIFKDVSISRKGGAMSWLSSEIRWPVQESYQSSMQVAHCSAQTPVNSRLAKCDFKIFFPKWAWSDSLDSFLYFRTHQVYIFIKL